MVDSRRVFSDALNHRATSRIPLDLGATAVTGVHVSCVDGLRRALGLDLRPVKVHEPYQMLGLLEEDLQDALGIDVQGIFPPETMFGFRNEGWREFRLPWGQEVLVSEHFRTTTDAKGDLLIHPKGDPAAPPSGRLPVEGTFSTRSSVRSRWTKSD